MADDSRTPTGAEDQGDRAHASIPGLAEDIEDMWQLLVRERDEARARVAALERQLARNARPNVRDHLRLAWPREDSPREEPGGNPGGGRSAA